VSVRLASAHNLLKLWLVLVIICAVPVLLGAAIAGWSGAAIFAFVAAMTIAIIYTHCDRFVLAMLGARELLLGEQPALHSLTERLAARAGVVKPRLFLLPDTYPRAFSVGRGPSSSVVAISLGLLRSASPAEMEGLIAHELAHIRNRDVAVQSVAVVISATTLELTRIGGYLQRALLFLLGPVAAAVEHVLLSPKREFDADATAARLCGSPHGLADALVRLDQASELVSFAAPPASEPLYPVNPFGSEDRLAHMFDTHPPLPERLRRLRELDPQWRERLRAA
jgi:heat shock protein HtpX